MNKLLVFLMILGLPSLTVAQENSEISVQEKNIDKYLTYFSNDNPGAVVAVIKNGDIVFNKAYGLANIVSKEKLTVDKTFNLDELSKAFTSAAIMKLVEKKKLSLDKRLTEIFKDFPEYGRNIKVRNLLSHTSGLKPYDPAIFSTNKQVYEFLKSQTESDFNVATKMQYCNSDYALLAYIIEITAKITYPEYISKNMFKVLKMNSSWIGENIKNIPVADAHFKDSGKYVIRNQIKPMYGEQGIYTNSTDYSKWDKALQSGKFLKPESVEQIFTVEKLTSGDNNSFYGYGWAVMKKNDTRYYWHGGMGNGYSNLVLFLPDTKTTVLILTNRNDGYDFLKMAIAIAKEFDKSLKL